MSRRGYALPHVYGPGETIFFDTAVVGPQVSSLADLQALIERDYALVAPPGMEVTAA